MIAKNGTTKDFRSFWDRHLFIQLFVIFVCCYLINRFFNRNIEIKSLYMDDLANYYHYIRLDFWEYAFGAAEGQTHFRPVFYAFLYFVCSVVTGHLERIVIINGLLQSLIGTTIYYCLYRLSVNRIIAFAVAVLCLDSHLSYFQMGQMIGPIESLSMLFAILILHNSFQLFIGTQERQKKKNRIAIFVLYFLIIWTHERYAGLFVPIVLAFMLEKTDRKKKVLNIGIMVLLLAVFIFIRWSLLHSLIPAGTSNTNVVETFHLRQAFDYACDQVSFIFGANYGPQHLVGVEYYWVADSWKAVISIAAMAMVFIIIVYIACRIRKCTDRNAGTDIYGKDLRIDAVIIVSIAMYILSSSVTIRLEMRWIYISFVAAMIYGAYMLTYSLRAIQETGNRILSVFLIVVASAFLILRGAGEMYYRRFYYNIFFFYDLTATNSLAENTTLKYSEEELLGRKVYITSNEFALSEAIYKYFYEPFYGHRRTGDGRIIDYVPDLVDEKLTELYGSPEAGEEIRQQVYDDMVEELLRNNSIVLKEVPETHTFAPLEADTGM